MLGCLTAVLRGHTHTNPTGTRVHEGHGSVSGHHMTKHDTAQPQPNHSTTRDDTTTKTQTTGPLRGDRANQLHVRCTNTAGSVIIDNDAGC